MPANFFKTTIRSLWKNKTFSILNIAGLAIGLASAALIFLWVENELSFNNNFSGSANIYRVMENQVNDGKVNTSSSTPGPLADAIKSEIPGVKNAGRLSWANDQLAVVGEKSIKS